MKFFAKVIIGLFGIILLLNSSGVVLAQESGQQIDFNLQKDDGQEKIEMYAVKVKINDDSSVDIEEKIKYDFGHGQRHGIDRKIPVKYRDNGGNKRTIKIKNIEVLRDGEKKERKISVEGNELKIRIGKSYQTIVGKHTFVIKYTVDRAINYFDDHGELYWNVIGDEWTVPIYNVSTLVKAPEIKKADCFQGAYGSTQKCIIESNQGKGEQIFHFGNLNPGEFATIVVAVNKGVLRRPSSLIRTWWFLTDNWGLFTPFVVFVWAFGRWWKWGRDPEGRGTIIPYYDVPDNLSVAEVSAVVHNSLRAKDIPAMIIQLAVKGYIEIKKEKGGKIFKHTVYVLRKKNQSNFKQHLSPGEKYLWKELFKFGDNGIVSTDDLKDIFYDKIKSLQKQVVGQVISKGYLPKKSEYRGVSNILLAVVQMTVFGFLSSFLGGVFIFIGVVNTFILIGFAVVMGHRTKKGAEMKEKLLGLKLYLETAEKDRLKFHNSPAKSPKKFEKLLPYAMIFGVEKEWAEQFKDIYRQPPDWYQGVDSQGFNSLILADSLGGFSKTANASVVSNPSSASYGGSGFSGGGSGGGFGGGGGGSW